ncbi:hypothetical protein ACP4OV_025654 [Aristida adscensionis]
MQACSQLQENNFDDFWIAKNREQARSCGPDPLVSDKSQLNGHGASPAATPATTSTSTSTSARSPPPPGTPQRPPTPPPTPSLLKPVSESPPLLRFLGRRTRGDGGCVCRSVRLRRVKAKMVCEMCAGRRRRARGGGAGVLGDAHGQNAEARCISSSASSRCSKPRRPESKGVP